jgi:hypothetical protein
MDDENTRIQNETASSGISGVRTYSGSDAPEFVSVDPSIELKDLRKVMNDAGFSVKNDEEFQRVVEFVKELKAKERKESGFGEEPLAGDDKTWLSLCQIE